MKIVNDNIIWNDESDKGKGYNVKDGTNHLKKRRYRGLDLLENPPIRNLNNSVTVQ